MYYTLSNQFTFVGNLSSFEIFIIIYNAILDIFIAKCSYTLKKSMPKECCMSYFTHSTTALEHLPFTVNCLGQWFPTTFCPCLT